MLKLNLGGVENWNSCVITYLKHKETSEMFSFSISSAIHGFHVYRVIWENLSPREELHCQHEVGNLHNPLSVAVIKQIDGADTIVGHVPQRISALCNAFVRQGGTIYMSSPRVCITIILQQFVKALIFK